MKIYNIVLEVNHNSAYHVLLASYSFGHAADRHSGMSDDDVIAECLRDLAKIHQRALKYVKRQFRSGVVKRWGVDENSLGAVAYFGPYQYEELEAALKAPEGLSYLLVPIYKHLYF